MQRSSNLFSFKRALKIKYGNNCSGLKLSNIFTDHKVRPKCGHIYPFHIVSVVGFVEASFQYFIRKRHKNSEENPHTDHPPIQVGNHCSTPKYWTDKHWQTTFRINIKLYTVRVVQSYNMIVYKMKYKAKVTEVL